MFAELYLTDGTNKIDLLAGNRNRAGVSLSSMGLSRPQRQPSGAFRQAYGAVNETYEIRITDISHDGIAARMQELNVMLEQAANYFTSNVENNLVWLVSKTAGESNLRYAVIYAGVLETYGDVFNQPFIGGSVTVTDILTLGIERGTWLGNPPLEPTCLPISNDVAWNPNSATWSVSQAANNVQSLFTTEAGSVLAGSANILRTTNNGAAWTTELTSGVADLRFWQFVQEGGGRIWTVAGLTTGIAVSACGIYYSDNDGDTWTQFEASRNVYSAAWRSSDKTLFVGTDGNIYYSINAGTLTNLSALPTGRVRAIALTQQNSIIAGDEYNTWRIVGLTISITDSEALGPFLKVIAVDDYLVLGNATSISISRDDGLTWAIYWRDWGIDTINLLPDGHLLASQSGTDDMFISYDGGFGWVADDTIDTPIRDFTAATNAWTFAAANNTIYRRISVSFDSSYGPSFDTCETPVFVSNHGLESNWTHIFRYDFSLDSYTAITQDDVEAAKAGGASIPMFPSPAGGNDTFYVGISTSAVNASSFNNLFINLTERNYTLTLAIEYWDGAVWQTFTSAQIKDNTQSLHQSGLLVWNAPQLITSTINGVEAYWIKIRVTVVGSMSTAIPELNNVYIVHQPYVEIDGIVGDIPAIAQALIYNMTYTGISPALSLRTGRVVLGLRSVSRGENFTAYINYASTNNTDGIVATPGALSSFVAATGEAAAGEFVRYAPVVADVWFPAAYITLGSDVAKDFFGAYQAYVRLEHTGATSTECFIRLTVENFSLLEGFPSSTTLSAPLILGPGSLGFANLVHLGLIQILPDRYLSAQDGGYQTRLRIDIFCTNPAGTYQTDLYDLILIPADEWIGDFSARLDAIPKIIGNEDYIDIDSVKFPKRGLRSLARRKGTDLVSGIWNSSASGVFILQTNASQRLWMVAENSPQPGTLVSNWTMVHQVKLFHHPRWLALRGGDA